MNPQQQERLIELERLFGLGVGDIPYYVNSDGPCNDNAAALGMISKVVFRTIRPSSTRVKLYPDRQSKAHTGQSELDMLQQKLLELEQD